jgi:hypothetical protein
MQHVPTPSEAVKVERALTHKLEWQKSLGCPGLLWARDGDHEYMIVDRWTVYGIKYELIHVGFDRCPAPYLATVEEAMKAAQSEHDQLQTA